MQKSGCAVVFYGGECFVFSRQAGRETTGMGRVLPIISCSCYAGQWGFTCLGSVFERFGVKSLLWMRLCLCADGLVVVQIGFLYAEP